MDIILSIIASYLIGAIPTAYIFGRVLKKIDIRKFGSGNVGATNAFRVLGKGPGTLVLLLDVLKGVMATAVIPDVFHFNSVMARVLLGLIAVAGHNWTIFLQFKGGKGIATSLGVLIGLTIAIPSARLVVLGTVLVWVVIFLSSQIVSLASIIAAMALPIFMVVTIQPFELILLGVVLCLVIVWRHRPNIKRLMRGEESRVPLYFKKRK